MESHLNTAIKYGANREDILAISKMLDDLIYEYYNTENQRKRKCHIYKDV